MQLPGPLRDLMRYRRRKQLSVDGSVPGIVYNRIRRGITYATPLSLDKAMDRAQRSAGQDPQVYDPWHPMYASNPGYNPPYSPDVPMPHIPVPPFRLELPPLPPRVRMPRYRDSVLTAEEFGILLDRILDRQPAAEPIERMTIQEAMTGIRPPEVVEPGIAPPDFAQADHLAGLIAPRASAMEAELPMGIAPPVSPGLMRDELGDLVQPHMAMMPEREIASPAEPAAMHAPSLSLEAIVESALHDVAYGAMEAQPFAAAEAMMPMAEAALQPEQPLMGLHEPMEPSHSMSLDMLVAQLAPEPAIQPPEMPDPFQLMQHQFDQHMQMMDPFNMMGPMM